MRRHGRRDANHAEIRDGIRERTPYSVLDLGSVGNGCCDLLVGTSENLLVEVKADDGELTPAQQKFFNSWTGPKVIVRSLVEALAALGVR